MLETTMMAYNDEPSISINNHQPSIVIVYIIVNILWFMMIIDGLSQVL